MTRPLHPEEAGFLEAIAANPQDGTHRVVYADWLEEHSFEDEAFVQRWMGRTGFRPYRRTTTGKTPQGTDREVREQYRWAWYPHGLLTGPKAPPYALLPRALYTAIERSHNEHIYFPTEEAAVTALGVALRRLEAILQGKVEAERDDK